MAVGFQTPTKQTLAYGGGAGAPSWNTGNAPGGAEGTPAQPASYAGGGIVLQGGTPSVPSGQPLNPMGGANYAATPESRKLAQEEQYRRERETRYMDFVTGMMPQLQQNLGLAGGSVSATFGQGAGQMPAQAQIQQPDTTAAQNAVFARAKDKIGQEATGALAGLRSQLGGRGLLGSGAEFRGLQGVAETGLGQLGDVTREQAIQGANAANDFAKLGYQGSITQRGQDLAAQQAMNELQAQLAQAEYQGQITQRGQNLGALGGLMNLLKY